MLSSVLNQRLVHFAGFWFSEGKSSHTNPHCSYTNHYQKYKNYYKFFEFELVINQELKFMNSKNIDAFFIKSYALAI